MEAPEFSQRLRSVLDSCYADLHSDAINLGISSVMDSWDPTFKSLVIPSSQADNVTNQSQALSLVVAVANATTAESSAAGSSISHSFAPGRGSNFESVPFKRPKKVAAKPYENLHILDAEFSSKAAAIRFMLTCIRML